MFLITLNVMKRAKKTHYEQIAEILNETSHITLF